MKISLSIAAVLFYYAVSVVSSNCLHVGTVLFTTTDLVKKCWSESDKALLRARLIMQDVLPDPDCIDFSKPDVVLTLVDYFQSCFDIIGLSTYGNEQNLMYLAMSDALGGYLRGYILPLTKKAFYAGQVKYSDAKKLFRLYDDIRSFLNTNGSGWINPQKPCRGRFKAKPLVIGDCLGDDPCGQLYLIEKRGFYKNCCVKRFATPKLTSENVGGDFGKSKSEFQSRGDGAISVNVDESEGEATARQRQRQRKHEQRKSKSEMEKAEGRIAARFDRLYRNQSMVRYERAAPSASKEMTKRKCHCECLPCTTYVPIVVPLPVLDDCKTLHTIAVPFKIRPLRNVQARKSAFILEQYYITVIKCFLSKCSTPDDIRHFNAQFHTWLVTQVYPHLDDEQWYPAFGGVYRIAETIRKLGTDFSMRESAASDFGYIFSEGFEFRDESCGLHVGKDKVRDVSDDFKGGNEPCKPKKYFFSAVVVLTLVWVCTLCLCFSTCCAHSCKRVHEGSGQCGHADSSPDESQGERRLNFHFLVKFFRKKETETRPQSVHFATQCSPSSHRYSVHHFKSVNAGPTRFAAGNQNGREDMDLEEVNKRSHEPIKCKAESEAETFQFRECSIPFLVDPEKSDQPCFRPLFTPFWPYQDDGGKVGPVGEAADSKTLSFSRDKDNKNKLEKLWNNISNKIIKKRVKVDCEDARESSESQISRIQILNHSKPELEEGVGDVERGNDKKFSSCDHTESWPTTCFASTVTSSQTQVYTDFSICSQKFAIGDGSTALTHSSIEYTTDESESGREVSYASETESTETTLN